SSNSAISESFVSLPIHPEIAAEAGEWPFSVEVAADYLGEKPELQDHTLHIGKDIAVRLNHVNEMFIDYPLLPPNGQGQTMTLHEDTGVNAYDILSAGEGELDDLSYLVQGKIVLVGEVAAVAHDEFETPIGNVFGVEVIADEISTILRNGPLRPAPFAAGVVIAIVLMLAFIATSLISNPLPRNLASVVLLAAYIGIASWLYLSQGLVLSMSYMLLASLFAVISINARYYLQERGQKALIRSAFGQYLSPRVVADLVRDPERLALGGEEREMTAFFSDIQGFSTFSEEMSPSELVQVLNDYLTAMCNIIIGAEGTVDKFEGDAIIAFWGAPSIQADHAKRACLAAIDMQHAVTGLNKRWAAEGRPPIVVRMGLNSGPMVVGNMGSAQRLNYTIMGDSVNLASRLEGANKAYRSRIMISESTYRMCESHVDARELDVIRVVGKNEPVRVYELLDRKDKVRGLAADLMVQFEKARKLYLARDYAAARAAFKLCVSIDPEDGPSRSYLARCEALIKKPPRATWDGIWVLEDK
ncbi:MAG TPA: adenylate/guanylate cyclase domain-containing protein, partial [Pseudomonadales bacterium]|nr:adenylate/guanylate cyclase domain-containing protein [Pseudomonadales bacterium]